MPLVLGIGRVLPYIDGRASNPLRLPFDVWRAICKETAIDAFGTIWNQVISRDKAHFLFAAGK
jgi:hypothetical protein